MSNGKELLFHEEARRKLIHGIAQVADLVALTLGPKGGHVGLQSEPWPSITRDGSAIAKEVELKDPFENMGASMAKEVAASIKEAAGDGTATGLLLLKTLVQEGFKQIAAGGNPVALKRGMEKAMELLFAKIDQMALPIKTSLDTQNIATVSASGDREIGEKVSQCFDLVGKEGLVAVEAGNGTETLIDWVAGAEVDRGFLSPYFCTDQVEMKAALEAPYLLITDRKIQAAQELLPLLQQVSSTGDALLIVADDLSEDALATLVINKLRGSLKVAAIKAPSFGEKRKALLEDLALLTGGELISEEKGLLLKETTLEQLGRAGRIIISKDKMSIIDGKGEKSAIDARIAQIEKEMKRAAAGFEKEELRKRRAKLRGGVALIRVGGTTESEMQRKKALFEESLHATRAALEEGVVAGGGVALLRAAKAIANQSLSGEERAGFRLLLRACEAPFRQIVLNTGLTPSLLITSLEGLGETFGFNAETEKVEDLLACGVIDPVKVIKISLSRAVSMAGVVFLSDVLVV